MYVFIKLRVWKHEFFYIVSIQSVWVAIWLSDVKCMDLWLFLKKFLVNLLNILTSYN